MSMGTDVLYATSQLIEPPHTGNEINYGYLPPYRSLLTPHLKYDYRLHQNIELTSDEIHHHFIDEQYSDTKTNKIKMKYKSLLTDTKKKLFNSDLFSLSSTSRYVVPIVIRNFHDLPEEIIESILWNLRDDQKTLVNCLYVNKTFNNAVKRSLYFNPQFTSTYRVGQFITSLQQNDHIASYVKILNLSQLVPGLEFQENDELDILQLVFNTDLDSLEELLNSSSTPSFDNPPKASWRDWKYRDNPLYGRRPSSISPPALSRQITNSTLVSNSSSSGNSKFKYQHKSRSNSDATLVRPTGEFYEMYRNFDTLLFSPFSSSNSSSSSSTATSISNSLKNRKSMNKIKRFFKKSNRNHTRSHSECSISNRQSFTLDLKLSTRKPYYEPFTEPHPLTNKFLSKYSVTKDLPMGYIVHLLILCTNISELNLSNLSLSSDFRIVPNDFKLRSRQLNYDETYERSKNGYFIQSLIPSIKESDEDPSNAHFQAHYKSKNLKQISRLELSQNLVFLSDIGISNVDHHSKRRMYKSVKLTTMDIIESFNNLPMLKKLNLNNCIWLDKRAVLKFLDLYHHKKTLQIDFVNSGMIKNSNWGIRGEIKDLVSVFKNEERLIRNWESMFTLIHRIGENY